MRNARCFASINQSHFNSTGSQRLVAAATLWLLPPPGVALPCASRQAGWLAQQQGSDGAAAWVSPVPRVPRRGGPRRRSAPRPPPPPPRCFLAGFVSLLLIALQDPISSICVPYSPGPVATWNLIGWVGGWVGLFRGRRRDGHADEGVPCVKPGPNAGEESVVGRAPKQWRGRHTPSSGTAPPPCLDPLPPTPPAARPTDQQRPRLRLLPGEHCHHWRVLPGVPRLRPQVVQLRCAGWVGSMARPGGTVV